MNLSVGIVGLPNAGKSTLFNALLQKQQALAANYPFATIEPNVGVVPVPDPRLENLAKVVKTEVIIPATVKFVDIAGLVKGAAGGEGLGNRFLAHIREVGLIVQVLRDFVNSEVVQAGSGDPVEDYFTVETELQLADLSTLDKQVEPKGEVEKDEMLRWEVVQKLKAGLEDGKSARVIGLAKDEGWLVKDLFLLTAKQQLFVVNVGEDRLAKVAKMLEDLVKMFGQKGETVNDDDIVVIDARLEEELGGFSESERMSYLKSVGQSMTGLEFLIKKAYKRLGLISFFTTGEKEVRAWTVERGISAVAAAGVIHSDFEKNFISARICGYSDFVKYGGWSKLMKEGKVRQEGRDYVVGDGDVIEFLVGS